VKLAFFCVVPDKDLEFHVWLAEMMCASVKKHMPDVELIQLTDEETPACDFAYRVIRLKREEPLMPFRLRHLANLEGEWITLDSDCLVNGDLRQVFNSDFDVALTKRTKPVMFRDVDVTVEMPFNTGVMFSRNSRFWQDAYKRCLTLPLEKQAWWGDQIAVKDVVNSGTYNVLELSCDEWNYTPSHRDEEISAKVVHYKGPLRKKWMVYDIHGILTNKPMEIA
jgi:hypothetical protein